MTDHYWAILWRVSDKCIDGPSERLTGGLLPDAPNRMLFRTKREANEHIRATYGYIRERADLRAAPHGWMVPKAVRVWVRVEIEG